MNYVLKVTKTEENGNYVEEMKQWKEDNRYAGYSSSGRPIPESDIVRDVLVISLTEEQFERLKAEVISVFR